MTPDSGPIFLVEQDSEQANVIQQAFEELEIISPLVHFMNGEEVLVYLRQSAKKPPWLILLSVSPPETEAIELLETLKSDKALKSIPIILMASSYNQDAITQSFKLGAAGYMVNTDEQSQLFDTIKTIVQYWTLCAWPPNES